MTKFIFFPTFLLLATLATAQIPGPDSTFGRFGAAWRNIYPTDDQAFAVALRPNGRAVVAGRTTVDSVPQMAVFQYKTDGTLDLDFHWNGKGALAYNGQTSAAHAVAIDAEGRVLLTGYITTPNGEDFALVRLLANGAQDPTFGNGNGWATTDFSSGNDQANAIAIQPDGKIVVAGFTRNSTDADFALARYLPDGSLDPTFGTGGRVVTKIDVLSDIIRDITLQSNGKIIVCGTTAAPQVFNSPSFFIVARYLPDGSPDPVFGGFGNVITDIGADEESDIARAVALLPDGKIVVAGYSGVSLASKISVLRYRPNGLIDATFGTLGVARTEVFVNSGNFCTDILALADNSLLLSGMAENVDFKDVFLVKMLENGSPDPAFGQNGKIVRSLSPKDDNAYGMARRPDGRILVVGDTRKEGNFYTDAALLQFNANGSADAAFGSSGAVVEDVGTSEDFGSAVLVQPDGKVLVGGSAGNDYAATNWTLLRFKSNGQPDSIFGKYGIQIFDLQSGLSYKVQIVRQPTGKIVAGGNIGGKPVLVRFDSEGNIDTNFGSAGKVFLNLPNESLMQEMTQQADGKLLAVAVKPFGTGGFRATMLRFSADGQPDTNFGQNGQIESAVVNQDWTDVAVLPDGRIMAAGSQYVSIQDATVSRFLPTGQPDLSFGQNGTATFLADIFPSGIKLQKDGKAVVVGFNKAMRLNLDGTLDLTFGTQGIASIQGDWIPDLFDLQMQEDKRILLMGRTYEVPTNNPAHKNFLVARLNSDGSRDNTWGENGLLRLRGTEARSATFDPDGNILVVGSIENGERSDIVVYRLLRGEYVGTIDRPDEAGSRILNVFPNPVSEQLTLEYDLIDNQEVAVKMYSMEGRLLYTLLSGEPRFSGKNTERLTLPAGLQAGTYTVAVETVRGSVAVQVVVR